MDYKLFRQRLGQGIWMKNVWKAKKEFSVEYEAILDWGFSLPITRAKDFMVLLGFCFLYRNRILELRIRL